MAKPSLLLHIGVGTLSAGLFVAGSGGPKGFVSAPIGKAGLASALPALLDGLESAGVGFKGGAGLDSAYVSVHPAYLHLREIDVPFTDRKKLAAVLPFELAGTFAIDVSDAVLDVVPLAAPAGVGGSGGGQGVRALAVAIEKRFLAELLDVLSSRGIDPAWVGPAIFHAQLALGAGPGAVGEGGGGCAAIITPDFISVASEGAPVFLNSFQGPSGLKLSLAYLKAEGVTVSSALAAGWDPEELRSLLSEVLPAAASVEPLSLPGEWPVQGLGVYSLWHLVSTVGLGDAVNFRKGEFAYTREMTRVVKKLRITAVLVAALLVLLAGDYYVKIRGLAAEVAAYDAALVSSYQSLFPGEGRPADPLYTLRIKMKELAGEEAVVRSGVDPLDVMKAMAEAASSDPAMGITFNEVEMAEGRINARGGAASFEAANALRDFLATGPFTDVALSDVKSGPGGGVVFSLTMNRK